MVSTDKAVELVRTLAVRCRMRIADPDERKAARAEIGKALMARATSEAHAQEIIERVSRSYDEFPTLGEFERVAAAVAVEAQEQRPRCMACCGSGWVHAGERKGYSFAQRCACVGGAA